MMSPEQAASTAEVIDHLFLLMRTVGLHGPSHPAVDEAVARLSSALVGAQPPFSLQFVAEVVFRDRTLVPLDLERFERASELAGVLHRLQADEVSFEGPPSQSSLVVLGKAMADAAVSPLASLDGKLEQLSVRPLDAAQVGEQTEDVTPEIDAIAQIALAVAHADLIDPDASAAWSWAEGMSVVRRIERAARVHAGAAHQAVEYTGDGVDVARRAVASALLTLDCALRVGLTTSTARVGAHAALIVAITGLGPRGGLSAADAAVAGLQRVVRSKLAGGRTGVEPHRLRVCALLHDLAGPRQLEVATLILLAHAMEVARVPVDVEFTLTRLDLLSAIAQSGHGDARAARWKRALVRTLGVLPPGTVVVLGDGRQGVVLEPPPPGGDPYRPRVLVDGMIVEPAERVRLGDRKTGAAAGARGE